MGYKRPEFDRGVTLIRQQDPVNNSCISSSKNTRKCPGNACPRSAQSEARSGKKMASAVQESIQGSLDVFRFRLTQVWWARGADVGPATAAQRGGDGPSEAQSPEKTWAISRKRRTSCSSICSRPPFTHSSGVNLQAIRKWGHSEREVKIKL